MGTLDGAVAAVTAGTAGIGRAIVEAFVREGALVAVNGPDERSGEALSSELGAGDGRLLFRAGDVGEQRTIEGLVDAAVERFGRLDVVVLNAPRAHSTTPIVELSDEEWQRTADESVNHVFWGIRGALRHMIPRRQGRILVTSSVAAKLARPGASASAAAGHAIAGLVKSAAHEVGTLGIRVNAILPGVMAGDGADDDATAALLEGSALKRPTTADEVASVALMLARPSLAGVTGCLFPVDGGAMPY